MKMMKLLSLNFLLGKTVLLSYPKSGRTWLRYIFDLLGSDVTFTHAGHGTNNNIGKPFSGLKHSVVGRKTIFLHRNVLDTAVSFYFQVHRHAFVPGAFMFERKVVRLQRSNLMPPLDMGEFILHPSWGIENVCKFNRAWGDYFFCRRDTHVVSYEQLREGPELFLPPLLNFVGARDYCLADIIQQSSFSAMQAVESEGANEKLRLHGLRDADPESLKVRKGHIRGYRDYLSADIIERADGIALKYGFRI